MTADDLAYAYEAVKWTETQIPDIENRMRFWLQANIRTEFRDSGDQYLLLVIEKEPLPLSFSVEVGAYINMLRSSLDILACTLATRHGIDVNNDIYFPIAENKDGFQKNKLVKRLPESVRLILSSVCPYENGDQVIYDLHQMDITRKHRRLLEVRVRPQMIKVSAWGKSPAFTPAAQFVYANGETLVGFVSKGSEMPNVILEPCVAISERGISVAISVLLRRYVKAVRCVIDAFA